MCLGYFFFGGGGSELNLLALSEMNRKYSEYICVRTAVRARIRVHICAEKRVKLACKRRGAKYSLSAKFPCASGIFFFGGGDSEC